MLAAVVVAFLAGAAGTLAVVFLAWDLGAGDSSAVTNVQPATSPSDQTITEATVTVILRETSFPATFIVTPELVGEPASGYAVHEVQVDPPTIVLSGPVGVLQSIEPVEGLRTAAVDISGAKSTVTQTVNLLIPQGAHSEKDMVEVRVVIERQID